MERQILFENGALDGPGFGRLVHDARGRPAMDLLIQEVGEETAWELVGLLDEIAAERTRRDTLQAIEAFLVGLAGLSPSFAALHHILTERRESLSSLASRLGVSKQAIGKHRTTILEKLPPGGTDTERLLAWMRENHGSFFEKNFPEVGRADGRF
ncbi:hypothetical protein [Puniceicoccus vermicola]|uniref:Uncharacterized protein n=1 Tax=Puniceicoccus vermicola TaxID=388746 RepID=A0A7X1AZE9_9BACT|nr:hypothetical protein [Puniceicoccus vermicola]MBC2601768.1 hypothetical protein [Puniceicoccus vermicola]